MILWIPLRWTGYSSQEGQGLQKYTHQHLLSVITKDHYRNPRARPLPHAVPASLHSELLPIRALYSPRTWNIHSPLFRICMSENECEWQNIMTHVKKRQELPLIPIAATRRRQRTPHTDQPSSVCSGHSSSAIEVAVLRPHTKGAGCRGCSRLTVPDTEAITLRGNSSHTPCWECHTAIQRNWCCIPSKGV